MTGFESASYASRARLDLRRADSKSGGTMRASTGSSALLDELSEKDLELVLDLARRLRG